MTQRLHDVREYRAADPKEFREDARKMARGIVDKWIKILGLGFHPDTRGDDYVKADGKRFFTAKQARYYDYDMERLFAIADVDPYLVGIEGWKAAGLID